MHHFFIHSCAQCLLCAGSILGIEGKTDKDACPGEDLNNKHLHKSIICCILRS